MPDERAMRSDTALADAHALLALLIELPTKGLARGASDGSLAYDATEILGELGCDVCASEAIAFLGSLRQADEAGLYEEMRREHTRLFEHPVAPRILPYEDQFLYAAKCEQEARSPEQAEPLPLRKASSSMSGGLRRVRRMTDTAASERPRMFVNAAALDAEKIYAQFGLKRRSSKNVPADSMATELQFMSYLHHERARAIAADDAGRIAELTQGIEEFKRAHLGRWAEAFFSRCGREARIDFYRFVGAFGEAFFRSRCPHAE